MFYITVEWCQQSFLSTEDYKDAMDGLRMTRTYRRWTYFFRLASRGVSRWTLDPMEKFAYHIGLIKMPQKTILWTQSHKWNPAIPPQLTPSLANASPSIELTDHSSAPRVDLHVHDTPAMAHSLFPPAITTRHGRHGSDASSFSPPPRPSYDSSKSLIRKPSEASHHRTESRGSDDDRASVGGRICDGGRVSFEDMISPVSPPDQGSSHGWMGLGPALHSRQGYQRANSEPRSLPAENAGGAPQGLGLSFRERDIEKGQP